MNFSKSHWLELLGKIIIHNQAFINNRFVGSVSGETYDTFNPYTGELITKISSCTQEDVDLAVKAARDSFNSGIWSDLHPRERKDAMLKLCELMQEKHQEFALLESISMGKPVMDAFNIDVPGAIGCFKWYAEAIDKIYDEIAPTDKNNIAMIRREPVGVVAAVIPWNFPLDLAAWKLAPSLITGNSVILKPDPRSSLTALLLADLAQKAGMPPGVINVITGVGPDVGKALGEHMDVNCLTFTGSTAVGKCFMKYAGNSNMKQVWPETGGKSPNLIFADCDLDTAVEMAAFGIFFNQGEVCSANSRILVDNKIKNKFIEKFNDIAKSMIVGDPLEPDTQVGAMIDKTHTDKVCNFIDEALKQGASLVCGGRKTNIDVQVKPTILNNVTSDMAIAREEVFGPVAAIIGFDSEDEAVQIANDSIYGLAASVWTSNLNCAHRVAQKLQAGSVSVNTMDALDCATPFGGFKQSGFGKDLSLHAIEKFTQLKTIWIKLV